MNLLVHLRSVDFPEGNFEQFWIGSLGQSI